MGKNVSPRVWATLPAEHQEKMREWAADLGITFSQYVALCAWLGAKQLRRVTSPEESIGPDLLARVMESYAAQHGTTVEQLIKQEGFDNAKVEVGGDPRGSGVGS